MGLNKLLNIGKMVLVGSMLYLGSSLAINSISNASYVDLEKKDSLESLYNNRSNSFDRIYGLANNSIILDKSVQSLGINTNNTNKFELLYYDPNSFFDNINFNRGNTNNFVSSNKILNLNQDVSSIAKDLSLNSRDYANIEVVNSTNSILTIIYLRQVHQSPKTMTKEEIIRFLQVQDELYDMIDSITSKYSFLPLYSEAITPQSLERMKTVRSLMDLIEDQQLKSVSSDYSYLKSLCNGIKEEQIYAVNRLFYEYKIDLIDGEDTNLNKNASALLNRFDKLFEELDSQSINDKSLEKIENDTGRCIKLLGDYKKLVYYDRENYLLDKMLKDYNNGLFKNSLTKNLVIVVYGGNHNFSKTIQESINLKNKFSVITITPKSY